MRAAAWSQGRDIRAARIDWERARRVAEALPNSDPLRTALCIAPRMALCATTWRVGGDVADNGFDELRKLCESVGDDLSLAIGMYGQVVGLTFQHRHREASLLASVQFALLQNSPDAAVAVGYIHGAVLAKLLAGEPEEACRMAQWAIDLLDGDAVKGMEAIAGSPLAMTLVWGGIAGSSLGRISWRDDVRRGIAMERSVNPEGVILLFLISVSYTLASHLETLVPDENAVRETAEVVRTAEESGDDVALGTAYIARGMVLSRLDTDAERRRGLAFLRQGRELHLQQRILATVAVRGYPDRRNDRRRGRCATRDRTRTISRQQPCRER